MIHMGFAEVDDFACAWFAWLQRASPWEGLRPSHEQLLLFDNDCCGRFVCWCRFKYERLGGAAARCHRVFSFGSA